MIEPKKKKVLDLFSGIGGFSLGLESTGGFETVAFCEIDKYCKKVLEKHWTNVPIYNDVRKLTNERLKKDGIKPSVICGGFPCQDISIYCKGDGIRGEKSSIFFEIIRLVCEIRPEYVILENVSALLGRGMGIVLGEFSKIGYDCEWHCLSAASIGAPHRRDRIWIVAHPNETQWKRGSVPVGVSKGQRGSDLRSGGWKTSPILDRSRIARAENWKIEPKLGRVVDGFPHRLDRLRQLGNSLIPQIPEIIGHAILEHENKKESNE